MGKLYDDKPIPFDSEITINEAYIEYGRNDLHEMTTKELLEEKKKVQNDISKLKEELDDASNCPTYSIKSQIKTAEVYIEKINKQLANLKKSVKTESAIAITPVKPIGGIDGMLADLKRKLDKGIITKDYYDKYKEKLESRRESYEEKVKAEQKRKQEEKEKEEKRKNHPFNKFKNKIMNNK